jgi:hypothetical protein
MHTEVHMATSTDLQPTVFISGRMPRGTRV